MVIFSPSSNYKLKTIKLIVVAKAFYTSHQKNRHGPDIQEPTALFKNKSNFTLLWLILIS